MINTDFCMDLDLPNLRFPDLESINSARDTQTQELFNLNPENICNTNFFENLDLNGLSFDYLESITTINDAQTHELSDMNNVLANKPFFNNGETQIVSGEKQPKVSQSNENTSHITSLLFILIEKGIYDILCKRKTDYNPNTYKFFIFQYRVTNTNKNSLFGRYSSIYLGVKNISNKTIMKKDLCIVSFFARNETDLLFNQESQLKILA